MGVLNSFWSLVLRLALLGSSSVSQGGPSWIFFLLLSSWSMSLKDFRLISSKAGGSFLVSWNSSVFQIYTVFFLEEKNTLYYGNELRTKCWVEVASLITHMQKRVRKNLDRSLAISNFSIQLFSWDHQKEEKYLFEFQFSSGSQNEKQILCTI